jgi:hypothetical protein
MTDFKVTIDAGETIAVSRNKLAFVEQEAVARIRPTKFREILQIDSSIPWWAEEYTYDRVEETAMWAPAQDFTDDFVTASTRITPENFPLFELISGYRYRPRELARAQQLSINLDTARASAVLKKGESMLEHIAFDGTVDGTKQLGTLKGMMNRTDITPLAVGATTLSWELQFAAAATVDAYDLVVEGMVSDALAMEHKAEVDTKETTPVDTLVLPLSVRPLWQRTKRFSSASAEKLLFERAATLKRIVYSSKPDRTTGYYGADAGHTRRMIALATLDKDAARFVLPRAPLPGAGVQLPSEAVHVGVTCVVGGFNSKLPASIIYSDLDNAT